MPNAFELFGELKADTRDFQKSLRDSEARLESTEKAIAQTEAKARHLGETTQTAGRSFDRLRESLNQSQSRLKVTAEAFSRNAATSTQMRSALLSAETAAGKLNSKLADTSARLADASRRTLDFSGKLSAINGAVQTVGGGLTKYLTLPLTALGAVSIKTASSFDSLRNKMIAATGSADAANKKIRELRDMAANSAGVFTNTAADLFAFFKPMKTGEATINSLIKAFGRLSLADDQFEGKEFGRNLTQLFTQDFEMQDLKQAIGRMPRFAELVSKQFELKGSDLGSIKEGLQGLKETGKLSLDQFLQGFAEAVNNDGTFGLLTDTVGIRFQKMVERAQLALLPLGETMLNVIEPVVPKVVAFIETLSSAFAQLSPASQSAAVAFGAIGAAIGPLLIAASSAGPALSVIGTGLAALASIEIAVPLGLAAIALAEVGGAAYVLYQAWESNFGNIRGVVQVFASDVVALFNDMIAEIQPALDAVKNYALHSFADIKDWWHENGGEISQAATTVFAGLLSATKSILESIRGFWEAHGETIKSIASGAWAIVKTVITGAVQQIGNLIKLAAQIINGNWEGAWSTLGAIVKTAFNGIISLLKGQIQFIVGAIKLGFNAVWAMQGWISQQAVNLGAAIWQGMVAGIKAGASAISSAISTMATGAISTAKSVLGIQSPSKVFYAIGKDTVQGYIDGISALKVSAQSSIASLLDISQIKTTKADKSGVELLTSLTSELARLNVESKVQNVLLDLSAGKYATLNKEIRERILLAARELDAFNNLKDGNDKLNSALNALTAATAPAETELEKFNKTLTDPNVILAMSQQNALLNARIVAMGRLKALTLDGMGEGNINFGDSLGNGDGVLLEESAQALAKIPPPPIAPWETFFGRIKARLEEIKNSLPSLSQTMSDVVGGGLERVGDIFGDAVMEWDGTIGGFFKSVAKGFGEMAREIIAQLVKIAVMKAVMSLIGAFAGGAAGGGAGPAAGVGQGGSAVATGFATGGFTGIGNASEIAGFVHKSEYVMPAETVRKFGLPFMNAIKNLQMPQMGFATGGFTGGTMVMPSVSNSSTSNQTFRNHVTINVSTPNAESFKRSQNQIMREAQQQLDAQRLRRGM